MHAQLGSSTGRKDPVYDPNIKSHESLTKPAESRPRWWKAIPGQAVRLNRKKRPTETSSTISDSASTAVADQIPLVLPSLPKGVVSESSISSGERSWADIVKSFRSQVGPDCYVQILLTQSIESLEREVHIEPSNSNLSRPRYTVDHIRPLVKQLRSVSGVASAIAPTCPELGAIIWGSVNLIAWNTNNSSLVKRVIESLKPVAQDLERFGKFLSLFSKSTSLCKATEAYFIKVISLLGYLVMVLKRSKYSVPPAAVVENNLSRRLADIGKSAQLVEREAQAAKFEADEAWKNNTQLSRATQSQVQSLKLFECQPSTKFCGQESYLQQLKTILLDTNQGQTKGASLLLHGLGGVGKSELAIKFISDYESEYPYIIWIVADTIQKIRITIGKAFKELGLLLDTSGEPSGFVWRNWLAETHGWLLVFDNVEEETVLKEFWPRSNNGSIIVTSRHPHIARTLVDYDIEVLPMTADQSQHLLSKLLPTHYQSIGYDEHAKAEQICQLVDGLPLAIILVASLIREGLRTFGETLDILKKNRKPLLSWSSTSSGASHEHTLTTLWEANISRLPRDSLHLLQIMTFLDPDKVEEAMLMDAGAKRLRQVLPLEPSSYIASLRALSNFSLIRRNGSALSVHRLVQDVTMQRMDTATRYHMFEIAVDLVWAVFPKQENGLLMSSQWSTCQNCFPHVESLEAKFRELSPSTNSAFIQLAEVAYLCSWSLYERGMFSRAIDLAMTGIEITSNLPGDNKLLLADLWTSVGGAQLEDPMMFHDGYDSLEMALRLREDASRAGLMDSAHPQLANSYMSLGAAATGIERYTEAIRLGEKSIALRKNREEEQVQMLAMSYHNVSLAWLALNQLEAAETALGQALRLVSRSTRSMSPEQQLAMQCRTLYLQGNILLARGNVQEGKEMHERSLILRMKTMTETHPYTACSYWKLATLSEDEDWTKAVSYYRKGIEIYDRLSLTEAQRGRAFHDLGTLLQRHGISGSSECLDIARKIHHAIRREEWSESAMEPFKFLIHPFYW